LTSASPVVETLDTYPSTGTVDLKKLVEWPPRLKPVPVKPLFLDVAWNYIEYPGTKSADVEGVKKLEEEKGQGGAKEGRKGWFGFGR
jgi:signal recognition particle subunit SRP68